MSVELRVKGKDKEAIPSPGRGSIPMTLRLRLKARTLRIPASSSKALESQKPGGEGGHWVRVLSCDTGCRLGWASRPPEGAESRVQDHHLSKHTPLKSEDQGCKDNPSIRKLELESPNTHRPPTPGHHSTNESSCSVSSGTDARGICSAVGPRPGH